jgi:hypothetical protein
LSFFAVFLVVMELKLGLEFDWTRWTLMPRDRMMLISIFMILYPIAIIYESLTVEAPEPFMFSGAVGAISGLLKEYF